MGQRSILPGKPTRGGGFFLNEASPLHLASSRGHEKVVRTLIIHGAEIDKRVGESATPLQIAAAWGHVVIMQQLVEAGADVTGTLKLACCYGHLDAVDLLLRA